MDQKEATEEQPQAEQRKKKRLEEKSRIRRSDNQYETDPQQFQRQKNSTENTQKDQQETFPNGNGKSSHQKSLVAPEDALRPGFFEAGLGIPRHPFRPVSPSGSLAVRSSAERNPPAHTNMPRARKNGTRRKAIPDPTVGYTLSANMESGHRTRSENGESQRLLNCCWFELIGRLQRNVRKRERNHATKIRNRMTGVDQRAAFFGLVSAALFSGPVLKDFGFAAFLLRLRQCLSQTLLKTSFRVSFCVPTGYSCGSRELHFVVLISNIKGGSREGLL